MESTSKCSTATTSVAWRREAEAGTPPQAVDSLAGVVCVMEMEMEMEMEMAARQSSSLITNSGRRTGAVQSVVTMVAVRSRAAWCRWMWVLLLVRD